MKAKDGKLVVEPAGNSVPTSETYSISLISDQPCDHVALPLSMDLFIPDTAQPPYPLNPGQELWAEVTLPPSGPPRPIQLAISENGQRTVLKMN
jgi:hypothetical protein